MTSNLSFYLKSFCQVCNHNIHLTYKFQCPNNTSPWLSVKKCTPVTKTLHHCTWFAKGNTVYTPFWEIKLPIISVLYTQNKQVEALLHFWFLRKFKLYNLTQAVIWAIHYALLIACSLRISLNGMTHKCCLFLSELENNVTICQPW